MNYEYETFEAYPNSKRMSGLALTLALIMVYVVMIGGVEVFWFYFAGNFSRLMGAMAFMMASLVMVRVLGERFVSRHHSL